MQAIILDALLAMAHFLGIAALFSVLSVQAVLLRPTLIAQSGRWLHRVDLAYLGVAAWVLLSGLGRAVWGLKGGAYYVHNPLFHAKLGLFALIGLLSIAPTRLFLRWAKKFCTDEAYAVPADELRRARRFVMMELHLLVVLPVLAALMARGI